LENEGEENKKRKEGRKDMGEGRKERHGEGGGETEKLVRRTIAGKKGKEKRKTDRKKEKWERDKRIHWKMREEGRKEGRRYSGALHLQHTLKTFIKG